MARYVLCPRCELNFIDADEAEFCEVCIKELSGEKTFADDFEVEENMEETELCPICGENYMQYGEKMCENCKKKAAYEEEPNEDDEDTEDASWRSYLDDEEEDLGIPDSEFEDEDDMDEEEVEDEEEETDDFEYVSADDYYDFDDDDDEDDDDDDDDFDDDDAPTPKSGSKKRKKQNDDF